MLRCGCRLRPKDVRLGRDASRPGSTPWYGPSTCPWEAEAGWPAGSEQTHALFAERDLEEQADGSWLRASKSWPRGGVFHCYIAAHMYPKDGVRTSERSPSPVGLGVTVKKTPSLSNGTEEYSLLLQAVFTR